MIKMHSLWIACKLERTLCDDELENCVVNVRRQFNYFNLVYTHILDEHYNI